MKRMLMLLVLAAVFLALVLWRVKEIKGRQTERREGIESINQRNGFPVVLTLVQTGEFEVWRELPGKVEGAQQAFISTPDAARVKAIAYQIGDYVPKDTPIIRLDKEDPKNVTQVNLLRKVYQDALDDYQSLKRLYEKGGASADAVEKMRLRMESAKASLEAGLSTVDLVSPISGVLVSLNVRVGERPERDKTLAVVANLEKARVVAQISDREARELSLGQAVKITVAEGRILEGTVDRISLAADAKTGLFTLEMLLPNPQNLLKSGTYVTAAVRVFSEKEGTYVDSRCLMRDAEGKNFVYQVENNTAKKVPVSVVAANERYSLLSGLEVNLPVVLEGQEQLREGVKVRVAESE